MRPGTAPESTPTNSALHGERRRQMNLATEEKRPIAKPAVPRSGLVQPQECRPNRNVELGSQEPVNKGYRARIEQHNFSPLSTVSVYRERTAVTSPTDRNSPGEPTRDPFQPIISVYVA